MRGWLCGKRDPGNGVEESIEGGWETSVILKLLKDGRFEVTQDDDCNWTDQTAFELQRLSLAKILLEAMFCSTTFDLKGVVPSTVTSQKQQVA